MVRYGASRAVGSQARDGPNALIAWTAVCRATIMAAAHAAVKGAKEEAEAAEERHKAAQNALRCARQVRRSSLPHVTVLVERVRLPSSRRGRTCARHVRTHRCTGAGEAHL